MKKTSKEKIEELKKGLSQKQLISCENYANSFDIDDEFRKRYNCTDEEIYESRLEFALEQHKNNNQDWPFINY